MKKMSKEEFLRLARSWSDSLKYLERTLDLMTKVASLPLSTDPEFDRLLLKIVEANRNLLRARIDLARHCRNKLEGK